MKKISISVVLLIIVIAMVCVNLIRNNEYFCVDIYIEKDNENYAQVDNFEEFQEAIENENIQIIEITKDLDLGYNVIQEKLYTEMITKHNEALTHPRLIEKGISKLKISNRDGLIIYSQNGVKLLHVNLVIENSKNIKIENIKMEENWEWDEETNAEYDRNNWDYITIKNSENVCISHCEFSKSYDGIIDMPTGNKNITIEYCKINEMSVDNDFYTEQFEYLENNKNKFPMYKYLREDVGLSVAEIKRMSVHQFKGFLIGSNKNSFNSNVVVHDCVFENVLTRLPCYRNSDGYVYNIYVDSSKINDKMIKKNKKYNELKENYPKLVNFETNGIILEKGANIIVKNYLTNGVKIKYKNNAKILDSFMKIKIGTIDKKQLINKLKKEAGTVN